MGGGGTRCVDMGMGFERERERERGGEEDIGMGKGGGGGMYVFWNGMKGYAECTLSTRYQTYFSVYLPPEKGPARSIGIGIALKEPRHGVLYARLVFPSPYCGPTEVQVLKVRTLCSQDETNQIPPMLRRELPPFDF